MGAYRKTKIICTLGPASETPEVIKSLADAGMNIVRMNFSHGTTEDHLGRINTVREVSKQLDTPLSILMDTKGPEIRCGIMENDEIPFSKGDQVWIVKEEVLGNKERFHISTMEMFDDLDVNDTILIDDGKIRLTVLAKEDKGLYCRIENPGLIKTRKGVNLPNTKLSMPFISEKDEKDITFSCEQNVDFIALSFVRRAQDVLDVRKIMKKANNPNVQIIAKIESQEGYDNISEILEVSDGIMVARGDLGVEVSTQLVPIYQKLMIKKANEVGKSVITATHMLESMIQTPRPTRAEASDVANAILDGSDCIMLSGESAAGSYPVEAVQTMDTISKAIEEIIPYRDNLRNARKTGLPNIQDSIGASVSNVCINLPNVAAVIAFTQGGSTARRISKFRPPVPIIAVTFTMDTVRRLQSYWGVFPVYSDVQNELTNDDELACKIAKEFGIEPGKLIVLTAGYPTGEGTANMMKIIEVK